MRFLVTKTCQGVMDTKDERNRIKKAFRRDPETRRHLMLLMDAIDAMDWVKANRMLSSKWWQGRDKKCECPRLEFVGMLQLQNPKMLAYPADGFELRAGYSTLVYVMNEKKKKGGVDYKVEPIEVDSNFAPKGYHAVTDDSKSGCIGCAFQKSTSCGLDRKCAACERPDKQMVIFVANKES